MKLVSRETFCTMRALGYIKDRGQTPGYSDYTKTMKKHSKSCRHKYYVREDKLSAYLAESGAGNGAKPTQTGGERT